MKHVVKLFGVFECLHPCDELEGRGISLDEVRRIVDRHGGSVWAHDKPSRGATFGFSLPSRFEGS